MSDEINEKAERIWAAERELDAAIFDAVDDGIVVEISTEKWTNGTMTVRLLIKQLILPNKNQEKLFR